MSAVLTESGLRRGQRQKRRPFALGVFNRWGASRRSLIERRGLPGTLTSASRGSLVVVLLLGALFGTSAVRAADEPVVRLGVLQFGTVNWELEAMRHHGLDTANGVQVEIVPFASGDATGIALLGGEVDIIVSDWLWVSRLRSEGRELAFARYSSSVGALMVAGDSPVQSLADVQDLTIGVAGGPLDKSWLLLLGMAQQQHALDLEAANEIVFGAPPLLTEKARDGELDAVLNYWHFTARLEADGFRRIVSAEDAATALGAAGPTAAIGYVFDESWAGDNADLLSGFLQASHETKALLDESDEEWQRLAESGAIKDTPEALLALRDRYREGIPSRPLNDEIRDAEVIYQLLEDLGGQKLVGDSAVLVDGTFWEGPGSEFQRTSD